MYSKEQVQKLDQETQAFLKNVIETSFNLSVTDLPLLREVLRFHEYRYYILNEPLIADGEYDHLFKALEKIEAENPSLVTGDSPTQRVAKGLTKDCFVLGAVHMS